MLKKMGCVYDVAPNGTEAVNFFRKKTYACVLMDLMLPGTDALSEERTYLFA